MSSGKASAFLTTLVLMASIFASAAQAQQPQDASLLQYRVKFICGPSDGKTLALGNYFTAINLHNPIEDEFAKPISFRMKFAPALPGLGGVGHTDFTGFFDVTFDDALEIDCQQILGRARTLCPFEPAGFCKGFAIIESRSELDVVAVYTAAALNTHQVTTLHTDHILPHCPIRTDVLPAQTVLFVPPHVGGDADFAGHGPCVDFSLALRTQDADRTLVANYRMLAYECADDVKKPQDDYTSARGEETQVLEVASPRGRILGFDVSPSLNLRYIDTDTSDDTVNYPFPSPVESLRFVGDTEGDEAGTRTGVLITFRKISVELETCAAPSPPPLAPPSSRQ